MDTFPRPEIFLAPNAIAVKFFPAEPDEPKIFGGHQSHNKKIPRPYTQSLRNFFCGTGASRNIFWPERGREKYSASVGLTRKTPGSPHGPGSQSASDVASFP
jgi:hypothetical protein